MTAIKRIPVTTKTWEMLHDQRNPGETYDMMLRRLINEAGKYRLLRDVEEIESSEDFIPLEELDK